MKMHLFKRNPAFSLLQIIHQEVASDSFSFLINSSWLFTFHIRFVLYLKEISYLYYPSCYIINSYFLFLFVKGVVIVPPLILSFPNVLFSGQLVYSWHCILFGYLLFFIFISCKL